ncbi:putative redox protein [Streptomyces canus]|nr:putative redox protein [Streptomyces canus]
MLTDPAVTDGYARDEAEWAPHGSPAAVVRPRTAEEVQRAVRACLDHVARCRARRHRSAARTNVLGMSENTARSVTVERTSTGHFVATNTRGGTISFGTGSDSEFTPVELLLAALGGCTAVDVDLATSRHAEPTTFSVEVSGNKINDELGNRLTDLAVTFTVTFPDGEGADRARTILPRAVKTSHDRLCTVSRTVEIGTPVTATIEDA